MMNFFKRIFERKNAFTEDEEIFRWATRKRFEYFFDPLCGERPLSVWELCGHVDKYNESFFTLYEEAEQILANSGRRMIIPLVLGRGASSKKVKIVDITKLPHLITAGRTGSGKSSFLHTSVMFSLARFTHPEWLNIICLDAKSIEFGAYESVAKTALEKEGIDRALDRLLKDMRETFSLLKKNKYKDLTEMNRRSLLEGKKIKKKHTVVIFDEFAVFTLQMGGDMSKLIELASQGRAAGIHLIFACQRPEARVFNGLIKANFPATACFSVKTALDSRIALGVGGSERINKRGRFLFDFDGKIQVIDAPKPCSRTLAFFPKLLEKKNRIFKYRALSQT